MSQNPTPGQPLTTTHNRAEQLLRPEVPRTAATGYVDTLPGLEVSAPGRAQAAWQTDRGSRLYQRIQPALASLLLPAWRTVATQLQLRPGQTVLDVGCGPGNITTRLADATAPGGLAVGLDISAPMLSRAAASARPNMALLRGDADELPLTDGSVDAACATAVVMLVASPEHLIAEMIRVVTSGGRLLVVATCQPTGATAPVTRPLVGLLGRFSGARMFAPDDIPALLDNHGCDRIHSHQHGNMIIVRARKGT